MKSKKTIGKKPAKRINNFYSKSDGKALEARMRDLDYLYESMNSCVRDLDECLEKQRHLLNKILAGCIISTTLVFIFIISVF